MTCGWFKVVLRNTEYKSNAQIIYKRIFTEKEIGQFRLKLHNFGWKDILVIEDANKA